MNGRQMKSERKPSSGGEVGEVIDSIRRIVRLFRLASHAAQREVGVSGAQLFVLQKLGESKMLSVTQLADRAHADQSTVSVVVRTLVGKGLVTRAYAAADARRLELTLTRLGEALLRRRLVQRRAG
jgi:DNA-binding MarR family transcriptional regulator